VVDLVGVAVAEVLFALVLTLFGDCASAFFFKTDDELVGARLAFWLRILRAFVIALIIVEDERRYGDAG
jgi:hypothetical protein